MKIKIYIKDILLNYDVPQLFVACDSIGTNYLCMLVEQNPDFDNFVCVQISRQKLANFYNGNIDLKAIFQQPEINIFYVANISDYEFNSFEIIASEFENIPQRWLPDKGVFINLEKEKSEILIESKEKANTIS